jgi:hypothetical protein
VVSSLTATKETEDMSHELQFKVRLHEKLFLVCRTTKLNLSLPWRRGLVVSSLTATKETEDMSHEFESQQGLGWQLFRN